VTVPSAQSATSAQPWTRFQLAVAVICAVDYLLLGPLTFSLLYTIPGERYLLPADSDLDSLGLVAAPAAPIILIASCFTQKPAIIVTAAGLVVLAIIWTVRAFVLLSYL
jgi:hypothetical protein